jgi:hypothetical protein
MLYPNPVFERFARVAPYFNSVNEKFFRDAPYSSRVNERFCEMVDIPTQVFVTTH